MSLRKPTVLISILLLGFLSGACNLPASPVPEGDLTLIPDPGETDAPAATENAQPQPQLNTPGPAPTTVPPERTTYRIQVAFDYQKRTADVEQEIVYVNQTAQALSELILVVDPNRYPGSFTLHSLTGGEASQPLSYSLDGMELRVQPEMSLPPQGVISLRLDYSLSFPDQGGVFGATERQVNAGNWYPFVAPHREGEDWLIHEPNQYGNLTLGEHLVYEKADFAVQIELVGENKEDVVLVASGPVERQGRTYTYHAPNRRNFTWTASEAYQIRETTWRHVTIQSVFFPEHQKAGESALAIMRDSLQVFSETFAPYPHQTLTMVESEFPDGAEFEGLFFLSSYYYQQFDTPPRNYFTILTAHETAHNWWYGMVGSDQALEPWLDEILATYSERIYLQEIYPADVDWWYDFRVRSYQPEGWVNSPIYDFKGFRPYVNAVYLRGASFLYELEKQMGSERFRAFLSAYAKQNAGKIATGADFFSLLEESAPEGIQPLIQTYFAP
jgi:hypothetical protein